MTGDPDRVSQKASTDLQKKGPTVLVIDDDPVGRTLVCDALREAFPVLLESSSPIGTSRTVIQENVDVVVVDVEMPNLRGNKLARLFRENPRLAYIGIILVSACDEDALATLGESCGADGVVTKADIRTGLPTAVTKAWRLSVSRRAAAGTAPGGTRVPGAPSPPAGAPRGSEGR